MLQGRAGLEEYTEAINKVENVISPGVGVKEMPGVQYVTAVPGDAKVVSMIEFRGIIYVATSTGVYMLVDDKLKAVEFEIIKGE